MCYCDDKGTGFVITVVHATRDIIIDYFIENHMKESLYVPMEDVLNE